MLFSVSQAGQGSSSFCDAAAAKMRHRVDDKQSACHCAASNKGSAPSEGLLATLARLAGERDNALRSAALSGLEYAYMFEGEGGFRSDKETKHGYDITICVGL
jgi:hypothetical protein